MKLKERKRKIKKGAKITIRDVQVNIENLILSEDEIKFLRGQNLSNFSDDTNNDTTGATNHSQNNTNSINYTNFNYDETENINKYNLTGDKNDQVKETIENKDNTMKETMEWILRYVNPKLLSTEICIHKNCTGCSWVHSVECSICLSPITINNNTFTTFIPGTNNITNTKITGSNLLNVFSKHLVKHKVVEDMFEDIPDSGPFSCKCSPKMQNLGFFNKTMFLDHLVTAHKSLSPRFQIYLKTVCRSIREKVLDEMGGATHVDDYENSMKKYEILMKAHIDLIYVAHGGKPDQQTLKLFTQGLEDDFWDIYDIKIEF